MVKTRRLQWLTCACVVNKQRSSRAYVEIVDDAEKTVKTDLARVNPAAVLEPRAKPRQIDRMKNIGFRRRHLEKFACLHFTRTRRHWYSSRISGCYTMTGRWWRRRPYCTIIPIALCDRNATVVAVVLYGVIRVHARAAGLPTHGVNVIAVTSKLLLLFYFIFMHLNRKPKMYYLLAHAVLWHCALIATEWLIVRRGGKGSDLDHTNVLLVTGKTQQNRDQKWPFVLCVYFSSPKTEMK